jgi:hypothetical protein
MILAYAKTAQGGWRFWPFQLKSLFDLSDSVKSAEKKMFNCFLCAYPFLRLRRQSVSLLQRVTLKSLRGPAQSNQTLLALSFGASPRLGIYNCYLCLPICLY